MSPIPEGLWFTVNERMLAFTNRHHPTPEFDSLTPEQRALFAIVILDVEIGSRSVGAMLGRGCVWLIPFAIAALDDLGLPARARLLEQIAQIAAERGLSHREPGETGRMKPVADPRFASLDDAWNRAEDRRAWNRRLSTRVHEHPAAFPEYTIP